MTVDPASDPTSYRVDGMTCGHCAAAVQEEVAKLTGVDEVGVDVEAGQVSVFGTVDEAALAEAIDEAGYRLVAKI